MRHLGCSVLVSLLLAGGCAPLHDVVLPTFQIYHFQVENKAKYPTEDILYLSKANDLSPDFPNGFQEVA